MKRSILNIKHRLINVNVCIKRRVQNKCACLIKQILPFKYNLRLKMNTLKIYTGPNRTWLNLLLDLQSTKPKHWTESHPTQIGLDSYPIQTELSYTTQNWPDPNFTRTWLSLDSNVVDPKVTQIRTLSELDPKMVDLKLTRTELIPDPYPIRMTHLPGLIAASSIVRYPVVCLKYF